MRRPLLWLPLCLRSQSYCLRARVGASVVNGLSVAPAMEGVFTLSMGKLMMIKESCGL